uniref:Uncharacterized protein n=1 Tax=Arundo donax TaxID=35708 RepID=A0A0A8Y492_ARUDO
MNVIMCFQNNLIFFLSMNVMFSEWI